MKKFLLLSAIALITATALHAQTVTPIKYKTIGGKIIDVGTTTTMTTTDSAIHTINTVAWNKTTGQEAGVLRVTVIGYNDSLGVAVTGSQIVRYAIAGGTLTLGTPANLLAKATDTDLGTATWAISTSSNHVIVTVKGKLTYTILWRATVEKYYQTE